MAKKSDIARGAGMLAQIYTKLEAKVLEYGGDYEDLHRLSTEDGDTTVARMAEVVMDARTGSAPAVTDRVQAALSGPFTATIDYGKSPKTQARRGDFPGGYNDAYDRMAWSDWQVQPGLDLAIPKRGTQEKELFLFHLGAWFGSGVYPTTTDVLQVLADHGLTPEPAQAIPAIGAADPRSGVDYPTVALGSFLVGSDGDRDVAGLWRSAGGRRFGLRWDNPGDRWPSDYRVVVSRA